MSPLNTTIQIIRIDRVAFPCERLDYCPYGRLVEEFPETPGELACPVFGNHCPVYYHAECVEEKDD